jgi:serine/threonine-protein phosphatase 2A activator
MDILDCMEKWKDEIPPTKQPQRFGNKAFRDWYDRMLEVLLSVMDLNITLHMIQ